MAKKSIYKTENGKQLIQNDYSQLLSNWVHPSKQQFIKTQLGDTFVIESGKVDAPAVILLHGSGSNSAMWMADAKELSGHFHVLLLISLVNVVKVQKHAFLSRTTDILIGYLKLSTN